ncbi:MAG: putative toxin-antitoxin system toxin component, PIN family [Bryobacterales bacterium]|nr:putative toxin-antitoxin system toxin component, PIN family [Bryobacterales bacterium]
MVRVVIDTNVVTEAMLTSGVNRSVLRLCLMGKVRPLIGTALFLEYEDLIRRPGLFARSRMSARGRLELLAALASVSEWVEIYYTWRPNLRDEGDNHLVELAVAGSAEMIVTHNVKDLRSGELHFPSIRILTPADLLKELP